MSVPVTVSSAGKNWKGSWGIYNAGSQFHLHTGVAQPVSADSEVLAIQKMKKNISALLCGSDYLIPYITISNLRED
jgi:hypothetical protein